MRIEHIALWVCDLERMKNFYVTYFNATSNELYHNPTKGFTSYFLTFESGSRLELMNKNSITSNDNGFDNQKLGLVHLAFSVGSKEEVNRLTELLRSHGYRVAGEPRTSGDGYYESVILDPENNIIELLA